MIGELIIWFRNFWRTNTCRHNYEIFYKNMLLEDYSHYICTKCEKSKWFPNSLEVK